MANRGSGTDASKLIISARAEEDTSDGLAEFASFDPPDDHDRFFVSIGAQGVGAGDEAGVDDVFFAPR